MKKYNIYLFLVAVIFNINNLSANSSIKPVDVYGGIPTV